jgi:hypothetical protein
VVEPRTQDIGTLFQVHQFAVLNPEQIQNGCNFLLHIPQFSQDVLKRQAVVCLRNCFVPSQNAFNLTPIGLHRYPTKMTAKVPKPNRPTPNSKSSFKF